MFWKEKYMDLCSDCREISVQDWLSLSKKMHLQSSTPYLRVSNNIFHSLQWIGKDVIHGPNRKYYGLFIEEKLVCGFGLYFLSPGVLRARNFFCEPEWRQQGLMRRCLEYGLQQHSGIATKVLSFSTNAGISFHLRCSFKQVEDFQNRSIEYYDFEQQKYRLVEEETITLFERDLRVT